MLMLFFKVSLTVLFMPGEEDTVGYLLWLMSIPQSDPEGTTQINEKAHSHP